MHLFSLALTCVLALSGCSVTMAAKKSGHSMNDVQNSTTRAQLLQIIDKTITSERNSEGRLVETYSIQKERGSTARAVMHGVLDLSTFFIWEVVGTPMEGAMNKKEYIVIKVTYASDDSHVERVELQ